MALNTDYVIRTGIYDPSKKNNENPGDKKSEALERYNTAKVITSSLYSLRLLSHLRFCIYQFSKFSSDSNLLRRWFQEHHCPFGVCFCKGKMQRRRDEKVLNLLNRYYYCPDFRILTYFIPMSSTRQKTFDFLTFSGYRNGALSLNRLRNCFSKIPSK